VKVESQLRDFDGERLAEPAADEEGRLVQCQAWSKTLSTG
jgi:hypothetical protein